MKKSSLAIAAFSSLVSILANASPSEYHCIQNSLEPNAVYVIGSQGQMWTHAAKVTAKSKLAITDLRSLAGVVYNINDNQDESEKLSISKHGLTIEKMDVNPEVRTTGHYVVRIGRNNATEIYTNPSDRTLPEGILRFDSTVFNTKLNDVVSIENGWTSWNSKKDSGVGTLTQTFCGRFTDN